MKKIKKDFTNERKVELADQLAAANVDVAVAREKTQSLRVQAKKDMNVAQDEVDRITALLLQGCDMIDDPDEEPTPSEEPE